MSAIVALAGLAASVAVTVAAGQDQNFDLITYHFYLGYSAFHERLAQDFFAASTVGYQSPLPFALLYLLDSLGVAPLFNAALHAALHAVNLLLLFLLTRQLASGTPARDDAWLLVAFWLAGAVAPIYWNLVGTSFADLLACAPVLGALWLAAGSLAQEGGGAPPAMRRLAAAGLLIGLAVAVRVHNVVFAAALALALCLPPGRGKPAALAAFGGAALAAWLVAGAPHAWSLYREFGNPVFPFFNGVFRSPDFPPASLAMGILVPQSLADALSLPFRIAQPRAWVYTEMALADVRPAVLVLAAAGAGLAWALRRFAGARAAIAPPRRLIMLFFVFGGALWLASSANARFGAALFLLAGPLAGSLLAGFLPRRYALLALAGVLAWQLALQLGPRPGRWPAAPWSARYLDWELPAAAARQPAVYLSFGSQTASTLAPRVHAASRHANLVGAMPLEVDLPGAERMRRLIETPGVPRYGVFDFDYTQQSDPAAADVRRYFAAQVRRWGLEFSGQPCQPLGLRPPSEGWQQLNRLAGVRGRGAPPRLILCELRAASVSERDDAMREYLRFRQRLAPLAQTCPQVLDAGSLSAVRVSGTWLVSSLASLEYRLEVEDDGAFSMQLLRPPFSTAPLGRIGDGGVMVRDRDCATWFARLVRAG
ncbi:MAG TPA: hypothetical protein VF110_10125 [Burkholderiales bacterium]